MLFEPYARDLAARVPATTRHVLEIAAGTGGVTRHLLAALPADATLTATDLDDPMLDVARAQLDDPRVRFHVADAQALPFADATFEVVA